MDELEKLIEDFNNQLEEDKKKKKKYPFSSMTITTGDPAHNIKMFNKRNGTDGMPNCDWKVDKAQKAAEEAASKIGTIAAQSPDGGNSANFSGETTNSSGSAASGGEGSGEGSAMGENLEERAMVDTPFDSEAKVGDKIRIIHLEGENNDYDGKEGEIEHIDGIGQLHGSWGGLAVIPGVDEFEIITEDLTEKLDINTYRIVLADYDSDDFDINVEFGWQDPEENDNIDQEWLLKPGQTKGDLVTYLSDRCGYTYIYVHDGREATKAEVEDFEKGRRGGTFEKVTKPFSTDPAWYGNADDFDESLKEAIPGRPLYNYRVYLYDLDAIDCPDFAVDIKAENEQAAEFEALHMYPNCKTLSVEKQPTTNTKAVVEAKEEPVDANKVRKHEAGIEEQLEKEITDEWDAYHYYVDSWTDCDTDEDMLETAFRYGLDGKDLPNKWYGADYLSSNDIDYLEDINGLGKDIKSKGLQAVIDEIVENKTDDSAEAKELKEEKEIPTDFAGIMDYLSKDEEEAIEGYDEVLDNVEDKKVKDNLEHIRDEEVAHKEYLDAAKKDPTVDYEHAEEEKTEALTEAHFDPADYWDTDPDWMWCDDNVNSPDWDIINKARQQVRTQGYTTYGTASKAKYLASQPYISIYGTCDPAKAKEAYKKHLEEGKLDVRNFHAAYDKKLEDAGYLNMFNRDGIMRGKYTYGRIKDCKNYELKAILSKFWVAQFKDKLKPYYGTLGECAEPTKLTEDKVFAVKMGGYVELPPQIKLIPQQEVEDAIRKLDPEEAFTVGYVTPIYFYKKLLDKFTLIKCTQMIGYTGVDYRAADVYAAAAKQTGLLNDTQRINQAKNQIANPDGQTDYGDAYNKENSRVKSHVDAMRKEYADINKTVIQKDKYVYERDPETGRIIRDANKNPVVKDSAKELKTILFYPMINTKPKVRYYIDVKDGTGYKEISRDFLVDTIYNKVFAIINRDVYNGTISHQEDMEDTEIAFLGDVRRKAEAVIANDEKTIADMAFVGGKSYKNVVNGQVVDKGVKPDVRALYTNQIYYLAAELFDISTGKQKISLGTKLIENLTEAKRYVRRYYMRPQDIFCSNKAEILKALIDHEDENCSIYTLNNLGDTKDVNKLTNDDIIYYYDDGILYDKNHVRIMDYDLAIKHEEDREKINPETTSDKTFKDVYDDRMTDLTELPEEFECEFEDRDAFGNKLHEGKEVDGHCCICGEEIFGYGNNAEPYAHGRCCDACNTKFVIPARIEEIKSNKEEE